MARCQVLSITEPYTSLDSSAGLPPEFPYVTNCNLSPAPTWLTRISYSFVPLPFDFVTSIPKFPVLKLPLVLNHTAIENGAVPTSRTSPNTQYNAVPPTPLFTFPFPALYVAPLSVPVPDDPKKSELLLSSLKYEARLVVSVPPVST